ncbi:MAG: sortase [Acidimicrobiales bacterium]
MTWRRLAGIVGRILLGCGVLLLLFVAYQLWGTGILESRSQATLRAEFRNELRRSHDTVGRQSTTTSTSTTPSSTVPASTSVVPTTLLHQRARPEVPPALGQPVGVIEIPKINVNSVVVQGTAENDLSIGPGHYPGSPLPGQAGNAAIAGHRTTYGAPFFSLNHLVPGDSIYVTTLQGRFHYKVTSLLVVSPFDLSVVAPTSFAELTLTTCDPIFSAANRLVLHARLVGRTGLPPSPPITSGTGGPASKGTGRGHPQPGLARGLAGTSGGWQGMVWWGLAGLAVGLGEWLATRGRSRRRRWAIYIASSPVIAVVLFFFFEGVSSLLPPTF